MKKIEHIDVHKVFKLMSKEEFVRRADFYEVEYNYSTLPDILSDEKFESERDKNNQPVFSYQFIFILSDHRSIGVYFYGSPEIKEDYIKTGNSKEIENLFSYIDHIFSPNYIKDLYSIEEYRKINKTIGSC